MLYNTSAKATKHIAPSGTFDAVTGKFKTVAAATSPDLKKKTLVISSPDTFYELAQEIEISEEEVAAFIKTNPFSLGFPTSPRYAKASLKAEKLLPKVFEHFNSLIDQGFDVLMLDNAGTEQRFSLYDKDSDKTQIQGALRLFIDRNYTAGIAGSNMNLQERKKYEYIANSDGSGYFRTSAENSDYQVIAKQFGLAQDDLLVLEHITGAQRQLAFPTLFVAQEEQELWKATAEKPNPLTKKPQSEIQKFVRNKVTPTTDNIISDEGGLVTKVLSDKAKNVLIRPHNISEENPAHHANLLIKKAAEGGRPVFYIDNFEQINPDHETLTINADGSCKMQKDSALAAFLNQHKGNTDPNQEPLLIVNWDNFSTKQKLSLNTLLDQKRKIGDVELDPSIKLVSLSSSDKDISFQTRHSLQIISELTPSQETVERTGAVVNKTVDVQGFSDWRGKLFGRVALEGDEIKWHKSKFVEDLEAFAANKTGNLDFNISNLSAQARLEFEREVKQAKAAGEFNHHGFRIPFPKEVAINLPETTFQFEGFKQENISVLAAATLSDETDRNIINTHLFDFLLQDKKVENGKYNDQPGLIDALAKDNQEKGETKPLKLFISSPLSENQWYCLLSEAQNKGVKLDLHLAKDVTIPANLAHEVSTFVQDETSQKKLSATILVDTAEKPQALISDPEAYVVNVEDLTCQDLVGRIDVTTNEDGTKKFTTIPGLLQAKDRKIILKGKFSDELLQMIQPALIEAGENIVLIIEDQNLQEGEAYKPLQWLSPKCLDVVRSQGAQTEVQSITNRETGDVKTLENSDQNSAEFLAQRKKNFSDLLAGNQMIQLNGHSGVGKSSLIKAFESEHTDHQIYRELSSLKEWAKDTSSKTKVLFIDESNIEDSNLMVFAPLKAGGNQRIFYQGEFLDLSPNHKVVFACNPKEYGGGRSDQKLFEDGAIPALKLYDFPASYIYEDLLKKAIYDKLDNPGTLSPEAFKELCQPIIVEYQTTPQEKLAAEIYDVIKSTLAVNADQFKPIMKEPADSDFDFFKTQRENIKTYASGNVTPENAAKMFGQILESINEIQFDANIPDPAVTGNIYGIRFKEAGFTKLNKILDGFFYDKFNAGGEDEYFSNAIKEIAGKVQGYNAQRTSNTLESGADTVRELQQKVLLAVVEKT